MLRAPNYCSQCGGGLVMQQIDGRMRPMCTACGLIVYLNPVPSVAAVLMREGRVLLVRRNIEPGKGAWCLPGGFIELSETPEMATKREVLEETGLQCEPTELIDVKGIVGGYYGDLVLIGFRADITGGVFLAGEDADDLGFFDPDDLPNIAFREHRDLIQRTINR